MNSLIYRASSRKAKVTQGTCLKIIIITIIVISIITTSNNNILKGNFENSYLNTRFQVFHLELVSDKSFFTSCLMPFLKCPMHSLHAGNAQSICQQLVICFFNSEIALLFMSNWIQQLPEYFLKKLQKYKSRNTSGKAAGYYLFFCLFTFICSELC